MRGFLYGGNMEQQEKRKVGKPRIVLTEDQIQQVEKLSAYLNVEQMADYLGIGKQTFRDIMNREPRISVLYKQGRSKAVAAVASSLISKARSGDTSSMIFYLKTQAGWKEKQEIDITSSDGALTPWKSIKAGTSGKNGA